MFFFSRCSGSWQSLLPRKILARGILFLIGVVLLTAAALKTHELAIDPMQENSLFTSRWFLTGFVECELALGLWLLVGAYPKQARLVALAAFAGFCLVSLYQALTGSPSCGCFGRVTIKPWHTLLFDLAALKIEWGTRSARGSFGSDIGVAYKRIGQEKPQITRLRIEAQVAPDIEYQPPQLVFAPGEKAKQVIAFSARDPKATVMRAYSIHRAFTTRLLENNAQVEVAFDPSQWTEENPATELLIETSSANEPLIKIPLLVKQVE